MGQLRRSPFFSKACSIEIDHETVLFGLEPESPLILSLTGLSSVIHDITFAHLGGKYMFLATLTAVQFTYSLSSASAS